MENTFKLALQYIKNLPTQPGQVEIGNEDKLSLYGLFKQATVGQNKTKAPSRLKVVQKMKWDSWKKWGKMGKEEAMKTYVQKLTKLDAKWNVQAKL